MNKETKFKVQFWIVVGGFVLAVLLTFGWAFFTQSGQETRTKNQALREADEHTRKVKRIVSEINRLVFVKRHGANVCFAVGNNDEIVASVPCEDVEGLLINPPTDIYGKPISKKKGGRR